jgi:hypothetical protein
MPTSAACRGRFTCLIGGADYLRGTANRGIVPFWGAIDLCDVRFGDNHETC